MQNIKQCWLRKYKIIGNNNKIIIKQSDGVQIVLGKHKKISGLDIEINGNNNTVCLTDKTIFKGSKIVIVADDAVLNFEESPEINNLSVFIRNGNKQHLKWGKNTTITGGYIELCESGASVTIGQECMIGWHISIVATDFHSVLDRTTGQVLNGPGNVVIGDNCWLGHGVRLLKNAKLPNNTIVGAETIVTKAFTEEWTALGGNPAKIIKRDVTWNRSIPTEYKKTVNSL